MDSLRFGYEEHFDTFESFMSMSEDDSQGVVDTLQDYEDENIWNWEKEEEVNGDVAVIPTASYVENQIDNNSPPVKEDFQKIMNEWQQLINFECEDIKDITMDMDMISSDQFTFSDSFNLKSSSTSFFDLPDQNENSREAKKVQHGGKRLDLKAQCYVVDDIKEEVDSESENIVDVEGDFQVDIETFVDSKPPEIDTLVDIKQPVTEMLVDIKPPVIETQDAGSLLELFEAKIEQIAKVENSEVSDGNSANYLNDLHQKIKIEEPEITEETPKIIESNEAKTCNELTMPVCTKSEKCKEMKRNGDELPTELINKIKASNKRRFISIIDVIPQTKRMKHKRSENKCTNHQEKINSNYTNGASKNVISDWIHLDHDYCGSKSLYSKFQKKDSGIESAEEDEQRNILKNQPTVKRADGKLMVSLLKVNTIKNIVNSTTSEAQKKRKLNLEEYKKRREGILKSYENSQQSSPLSSGRNSPTIEDENMRRLKHQEKLLHMAAELLKSSPKSKKTENSNCATEKNSQAGSEFVKTDSTQEPKIKKCDIEKNQNREKRKNLQLNSPQKTDISVDNEVVTENVPVLNEFITKTIVSIGVNTEYIKVPLRKNKQISVSPIKQLEEIKPILQNANGKINSNSLIASVIENIQNKVKTVASTPDEQNSTETNRIHGEDRTIVYLSKGRKVAKTCDVYVQTDFSEDWIDLKFESSSQINTSIMNNDKEITKNRSRKKEEREIRERSSDRSSRSSSIESRYSYSSSSSSRSRSISPQRVSMKKKTNSFNKDHLRAVEERRIVYVGGISSLTTREDLRRRFHKFGPITNISIHFRDYGDNYGFVTFMYNVDAYEAVEHGNDDPSVPHYDLSFGGRRIFCRTRYSDLDNIREEIGYAPIRKSEESFDNLLREMQAKLCKRKTTT